MTVYQPVGHKLGQQVWWCLVLLAAMAGVVMAVAAWGLGGALATVAVVGTNAACIRHLVCSETEAGGWREAVRTGLVSGVLVLGACGLISWLGWMGLLVIVLLALTSRTVVSEVLKRTRRHLPIDIDERDPEPTTLSRHDRLDTPWMTRPTTAMDDTALCRAWRVSFMALRPPLSLPSRQQVVDRRQALLDELERRNPRGFQTWLASGARAASDPTRYISPAPAPDVRRHDQR